MNEDDSDSDVSDTKGEDSMAGPSNTPKNMKGDVSAVKPISKIDMVRYFMPLSCY